QSQQSLADIQIALEERQKLSAAAELSAERTRLDADRRRLEMEAEAARKRVEEKEAAFRTTIVKRDEMAGRENAKLEAQKAAVEKCLAALQGRVTAEQAEIKNRLAAEREGIAFGFEHQLEEQKRFAQERE